VVNPARYEMLRCRQSLYKSTYKGNAFKKGHRYVVHPDPDKRLVFVVDETGHPFSFLKDEPKERFDETLYRLSEYFEAE
jgi:hypothetical protein